MKSLFSLFMKAHSSVKKISSVLRCVERSVILCEVRTVNLRRFHQFPSRWLRILCFQGALIWLYSHKYSGPHIGDEPTKKITKISTKPFIWNGFHKRKMQQIHSIQNKAANAIFIPYIRPWNYVECIQQDTHYHNHTWWLAGSVCVCVRACACVRARARQNMRTPRVCVGQLMDRCSSLKHQKPQLIVKKITIK